MAKQKKQSFLYGASILMASMIIVKLIGAVFKIPLVNILHESGMGYFNTAYTLFTTVYALTVTGLSAGVARMVAENCAKGRYRDVKKLLKISTIIFIILGTLGFLIIALSAKSFSV
ncbi:MAG: oligosaccharide flippase family protein, partial [Oscillospiraceae bacterium]